MLQFQTAFNLLPQIIRIIRLANKLVEIAIVIQLKLVILRAREFPAQRWLVRDSA